MNHKIFTAVLTAGLAAGILTASAEDKGGDVSKLPPAAKADGVTFDKDIKPIFDKSCMPCHKGEKPKGKLNLETLEGVMKGGKDGKVVVAGKIADSPLLFAVAHIGDDQDEFMPPLHNKRNIEPLTADQVGVIRAWIEQGAK
jgi:hypothetical protein